MQDNTEFTSGSTTPDVDINSLENRLRLAQPIIEESGIEGDPLTFTSVQLINGSFPHGTRGGDKREQICYNGRYRTTMYCRYGLPYGKYPRLIMYWLATEAVRRNAFISDRDEARTIPLGDSFTAFARDSLLFNANKTSGLYKGNTGSRRRLSGHDKEIYKKHLFRLLNTTISVDRIEQMGETVVHGWENTLISDEGFLWWDTSDKQSNEADFGFEYVKLSEQFFQDLIEHAVPLNKLHVYQLQKNVLALDLYSWATYRLSYHDGFTRVTLDQLKKQLANGYPDTPQGRRHFKSKINAAISLIKKESIWPDAGIELRGNIVLLHGKAPAVPKLDLSDPNVFPYF